MKYQPKLNDEKKKYTLSLHWSIPEKKTNRGKGVEGMELPRVCGISRSDQEKIMWIFEGYWFLVWEFPSDVKHNFEQFPGVEL